jgi:Ca2+-binding RTX toxin-like protein
MGMPRTSVLTIAALLCLVGVAWGKADHQYWPKINGKFKKAGSHSVTYVGGPKNDELLGHHGSDVLRGTQGSDVLWGDWDGNGQPASQRDRIYGGEGTDFIYGSHGRNRLYGGPGNDMIYAHYGRGFIDCGPGRDIYHVPISLKKAYKVVNCEKVDRRSESQRGGGLKPLP